MTEREKIIAAAKERATHDRIHNMMQEHEKQSMQFGIFMICYFGVLGIVAGFFVVHWVQNLIAWFGAL